MKYQVFGILWTVFNLALMLVMGIVGIYLLWLVIKALRFIYRSPKCGKKRKATRKSLAEALREPCARKMTQEFVSEPSVSAARRYPSGKAAPRTPAPPT